LVLCKHQTKTTGNRNLKAIRSVLDVTVAGEHFGFSNDKNTVTG